MNNSAAYPPEDHSFITTRMLDKYLPAMAGTQGRTEEAPRSEADERLIDELKRISEGPELYEGGDSQLDSLDYVSLQRAVGHRRVKFFGSQSSRSTESKNAANSNDAKRDPCTGRKELPDSDSAGSCSERASVSCPAA